MTAPFSEDFMHVSARLTTAALIGLTLATVQLNGAVPLFQSDTAKKGYGPFSLTVDSIMRGPKLVGYPQAGLRWSGDSTRLYFEWRRPGDDEPFTYVVEKDGGEPRRLSDEERRSAPPVNGVWDTAHRRVLFV